MRVRRAVSGDVPWLLGQLRAFAAEHPLGPSVMGADPHIEALLAELMDTQLLAVAERDGELVGFIAAACAPHPFNPAFSVATELAWWVVPPARGSRAGAALLAHYHDWAADHADIRTMTLEANSPVSPDSLIRHGYQLAETQYVAVA